MEARFTLGNIYSKYLMGEILGYWFEVDDCFRFLHKVSKSGQRFLESNKAQLKNQIPPISDIEEMNSDHLI